jgi:hypothetical protein
MSLISIAFKKFPLFLSASFFDRSFHSSRIALFALVVLAVVSVACPAASAQGFALMGTWLHSEPPATPQTGAQSWMQVFRPDGTYFYQVMIAPRGRMVGTVIKRWSTYKATGASSFVFKNKAFERCASGGTACARCPGTWCRQNPMGWDIGVQHSDSVKLQGPNQFRDQFGQTWTRAR